jgi:hypothetical protein
MFLIGLIVNFICESKHIFLLRILVFFQLVMCVIRMLAKSLADPCHFYIPLCFYCMVVCFDSICIYVFLFIYIYVF